MVESLNPYQFVLFVLLGAWLIPLAIIWVRYDRLPHGKYLLIAVFLWPTILLDEMLRAYGWWQNAIFVAGLFQFTPSLIIGLLLLSINKLLIDKPVTNSYKFYLPAMVMFVGQIPFLILTSDVKQQFLLSPPTGDLLANWPFLAPHLLSGFVLLIFSIKAVELLAAYHQHLSDQVVDVKFYQFTMTNTGFVGLIVVAFISIILSTLATFDLVAITFWQTIINLLNAATLLFVILVLLERRRYSPTPLVPEKLDDHHFSEEYLRFTLKKAEQAIIKHKAYKRIGLRIGPLADIAGVEPQALAVATRTILKRNFRAFIYHYRLEYAKKVLMRTDAKVSTVAKRLGFNSEKFLSGMFVKYIQTMGKEQEPVEDDGLL